MKYLFSDNGLRILESFCFTKTLFAFDFDGTLAKIVPTPADARMSRETAELLSALNEKVPIAIISGRSIQDLIPRIELKPRYLIGNHGLEGLASREHSVEIAKQACALWKSQLSRALEKAPGAGGLEVEDKTYSLAIHYRRSRNKHEARMAIFDAINGMSPSPRVILGKLVVNLVPAGAPHKGVALMETMLDAGLNSAFFIGDDDTDEDVFTLPDSRILTVRVGMKRTSQAQYFIKRQAEINRLIRHLLRFSKEES